MRLAHVHERNAPAGAPWRLAAALGGPRWLDLEPARRRLVAGDPRLAHTAHDMVPVAELETAARVYHRLMELMVGSLSELG